MATERVAPSSHEELSTAPQRKMLNEMSSTARNSLTAVGKVGTGAAKVVLSKAQSEMKTIWTEVGGWRLVTSSVVVVGYLLIGAVVFREIELPNEKAEYDTFIETERAWNESLQSFKDRILANSQIQAATLEHVVDGLTRLANEYYVAAAGASDPNDWIWDYGGSFFFSFTLITTIGYGSFAPATAGGKTFAVFYSVIGIPLFLNYLVRFALFTAMTMNLVVRLLLFMNKATTLVTGIDVAGKELSDKRNSAVVTGALTLLVMVAVILGTAGYAQHMEGWGFGDAVYFSFITFTTIGLGDFAPSGVERIDHAGAAGLVGYIFLIFFGLSVTGAFIAAVQEFLAFSHGLAKRRLMKNKEQPQDEPNSQRTAASEASCTWMSAVEVDYETGVTVETEEAVEGSGMPPSLLPGQRMSEGD